MAEHAGAEKCRVAILSIATGYDGAATIIPRVHGLYRTDALPMRPISCHLARMDHPAPLAPVLDQCRDTAPEWTPLYDQFVARLRDGAVASTAPRVGDAFPDFALPDERGRFRSLTTVAAGRPLVLSFNRGAWCPYCRGELSAWGERAAALERARGRFATVTGEVGGRAGRLRDLVGPNAAILCDIDHGLALSIGLAFRCDADLQRAYLACGLDLADIYGGPGWIMPVPATFVIDRDLTVRYAFVDPDFRLRAEPDDVLDIVGSLA